MLLPVDMREWLPEDDLVFVVLDAVAALDLGEFRRRYRADGHGRAAFDPEMMVALFGRNDGACSPALVLCQPWVAVSSLTMAARPNWRRRRLYRQSVSTLAACA